MVRVTYTGKMQIGGSGIGSAVNFIVNGDTDIT